MEKLFKFNQTTEYGTCRTVQYMHNYCIANTGPVPSYHTMFSIVSKAGYSLFSLPNTIPDTSRLYLA